MTVDSKSGCGYSTLLRNWEAHWLHERTSLSVGEYVKHLLQYKMPSQYHLLISSPVHQISFDVVLPIDILYSSTLLIIIDKHTL